MVNYTNYTMPDLTGSNSSNIGELFQWTNNATNGGFGIGILTAFFVICFGTMYTYTGKVRGAFASSVFMTTIIAIMLRGMDVVAVDFPIMILIGLTALSVAWLWYGRD